MPRFNVTLYRQVLFSQTVEVEADDEDEAEETARSQTDDDDTDDTIENWEAHPWSAYSQPDVEEIEESSDA